MLVAIDWYDMKLSERIIHAWIGHTKFQKVLDEIKMKQAEAHYNWYGIVDFISILVFKMKKIFKGI